MNRLETMLNLADEAVKMKKDDLYGFLMQAFRRIPENDLLSLEIEFLIRQAKKEEATNAPGSVRRINRTGYCPDCGDPNEMRGHMTCQYPSNAGGN